MMEPLHIRRWTRNEPYLGTDFTAYYVAAARVPNATDPLDDSNYETIKARLTERGLPFREEWFKHWAVGRLDLLLVHEDDGEALTFADEMNGQIEEYPILDEEDYCRREAELDDEEEER